MCEFLYWNIEALSPGPRAAGWTDIQPFYTSHYVVYIMFLLNICTLFTMVLIQKSELLMIP